MSATTPICPCGCGQPVERKGRSGPVPVYATPACRVRAHRNRQVAQELIPLPAEARTILDSLPNRPADEQLERAILEARALGHTFTALATITRAEFSWRCERVGSDILSALDRTFGANL